MGKAFLPPKLNPLVLNTVQFLLPWLFKRGLHGLEIRFDDSVERLRPYLDDRLMLVPNHPTLEDPYVAFALSKHLKTPFRYVAAREIFDCMKSFQGWVLQRCGAYSLIRGKVDRESFSMTRKILANNIAPLVIFIEGEVSHGNETLLSFETGVLHLAFKSCEETLKKNPSLTSPPPFRVVPIAISYHCHEGTETTIKGAVKNLEEALSIDYSDDEVFSFEAIYARLHRIGQEVIGIQEQYLTLPSDDSVSLEQRILWVKDKMLVKMEQFLEIKPSADESYLSRIRSVRNKVDLILHTYSDDDNDAMSAYQHRIHDNLERVFQEFYEELGRLVTFLTFKEGFVLEGSYERTDDRILELLRRLEKEVFGGVKTRHPRTALISAGEPVVISDLLETYKSGKEQKAQLVTNISNQLEADLMSMIKKGIEKLG